MKLQPVADKPVLLLEGDNPAVVIGDLHIGIESHLRWRGFHIPSRTDRVLESIIELVELAPNLIILGDVKHKVPGSTRQEYYELPEFFRSLVEKFSTVHMVKGNHDADIERHIDSDLILHPSGGMVYEDTALLHGHTWPDPALMACRNLVMAHNHPTVMFHDGVGGSSEPCWVRGSFLNGGQRYLQHPETFLLLPAYNPMLGGSPVNVEGEELLGPLLNSDMLDLDNARIYLLDGIDLGRRADLMVELKRRRRGRSKRRSR